MKVLLSRMLSFFPRPLPVGRTENDAWSSRIIAQAGNYADVDSMRFILNTAVLHMPPNKAYVSDWHFIKLLRKAAANQVSSQVFQEIKENQQKRALEAQQEAAKQAEASNVESTEPKTV